MTAVQLNTMNTELWQSIGAIADCEPLMRRLTRYAKKLAKEKRDVALMNEEEYFAKISGVDPNLDYIETYNKTITNTVYVPQKVVPKKDYLEFDAEFKYDKMLMAPVTVNIGHRYGPLDIYAGGGYDFITRSAIGQVGAKIQIGF